MDRILDAIIRANKLGRKNIMVTGYREPQTASESPELKLILELPPEQTASDTAWEDK